MKKLCWFVPLMLLVFFPVLPLTAQDDVEGSKDHPLFTRMKGYYINNYEQKYDQVTVLIDEDPESPKNLKVEGEKTFIKYQIKEGINAPSELQVRRNYQNAVRTLEGKTIVDRNRYSAFLIQRRGAKAYVTVGVFNDGRTVELTILEQKAMEQEITANQMWESLQRDGFMALYINFDTNKAVIKPESQPIVDQIVELMKSQPSLKLSVEGHTDSQGAPAANKTLSMQRAQAVLKAVVAAGINQSRLSAVGWGQEKPVADNRTEEGRAKNRRVEIVKK